MAVTVGSAVLFSLAPALRQRQPRHHDVLRAGTRTTADRPQRRLRALLVVAEVALALVLLVAAGLMTRSLLRLHNVDPGFSPAGVLSLQVTLSRSSYASPARQAAFYTEALARLRALPGVTGAAASDHVPFTGADGSTGFYIEGRPAPERGDQQQVHYRGISTDYFTVMGIPLATGRGFTTDDRADGFKVAIVNETMARRYWPGENPIGRRARTRLRDPALLPRSAPRAQHSRRHARDRRRRQGHPVELAADAAGAGDVHALHSAVGHRHDVDRRTAGDPLALAAPVAELVRSIDPSQPVGHIETVSSLLASSIAQPRAHSALLSAFALVALTLAMIGVFGLLAYDVAQRTPELGIRLALGGQPRDLRALILKNGLTLVAAGLLLGLPAAILAGRWLQSVLFEVSPADPVTLAVSAGTLIAVSLVACGIPARRATRIDPMVALRTE